MSHKQNDKVYEYQLETLNFVAQAIGDELREDESEEEQKDKIKVEQSEEVELS
jgi:hypothetical protein